MIRYYWQRDVNKMFVVGIHHRFLPTMHTGSTGKNQR